MLQHWLYDFLVFVVGALQCVHLFDEVHGHHLLHLLVPLLVLLSHLVLDEDEALLVGLLGNVEVLQSEQIGVATLALFGRDVIEGADLHIE